ncbi:MAG: Hsp20/alpha crystallin family protein [Epsilonproteobacteria bacterium]|nr:Hsp20/alpha crystallin family protein [Campylobacterota bacterium]PIP11292.1 MAG: heat-shock protein Hsp20 [Sulfurimonas sp. CG23_combo_of_CG06-09_8_20_14_all_36_33]PIS24506.1 MAG: heat-shock protein Hsp20 [Sulfurimonas sp. CG08_land_8_20_14_0_20_36_33]PIU35702.1 MAG: heat-shock protein Hsp20 [Sulfurimonas sp. CG07_land_8_20_14_0_80_36_56]PIV02763.1 MAG: heat-shock protein Hsp20 [Sulfurimonas sp. CG03_land_8_20_14_0_80_36_25]PIV36251.1 MAG: heat-shock protein Hsp20 [Sulfurimonas sp. CG02_la
MEMTKNVKNIGSEIEQGVKVVGKKVSEAFDNLASHLPFANLAKKENAAFHIEVDLPGVTKEDIDLRVEDDILVVSAVRYYKNELNNDSYYICESSFGKVERRFTLPENIDTQNVSASFNDGRLEIELQKTKKAQPKSIAIK